MPNFERVGAISKIAPAGIIVGFPSSWYIPTILRESRYFTITAVQAICHPAIGRSGPFLLRRQNTFEGWRDRFRWRIGLLLGKPNLTHSIRIVSRVYPICLSDLSFRI